MHVPSRTTLYKLTATQSGQPSITTLSSYEEAQTPRSSRARSAFHVEVDALKQVEGPRGPHLFRSSVSSASSAEFQNALSLSPITPKVPLPIPNETEFNLPITLDLQPSRRSRRRDSPFQYTGEELDTISLSQWSPEKVAQWMLNAGVELQYADMFVENDINGSILITLKFEDLKELGIKSFGARTKIWEEIHIMRNIRPESPPPATPIEDEPSREVKKEQRKQDGDGKPKRRQSSRRRKHKHDDAITPLESVSIVGIEQIMPKAHNCSKGENCTKWKRQQRMIEQFKKEHPFAELDRGGTIMIAGDPGNPETAEAIKPEDDMFRPVSDAIPSVVASSDVMGPGGIPPLQYLQEAALRNIQARDPQDNVRQFLDFQHQRLINSNEVPPTPPFEILPNARAPHEGLRSLPKLSIPSQQSHRGVLPAHVSMSAHPLTSRSPESASPEDQQPATAVYRFGTPFSEMDVPVTAVPIGPVARDFSQSVPPDMNFRSNNAAPPRSASRMSFRRPSFPVLPPLDENTATPIAPRSAVSPKQAINPTSQRPMQPPPRVQYPWSSTDRAYETAIAPIPGATPSSSVSASGRYTPLDSIAYQGPMKKRKTKLLRHEWHDHYFTLKGTRLAMHKDARAIDRTLEYIDIDDYAIACSSLASSKLNSAFKAMNIRRGNDKEDIAAFAFQLIPQDGKGGVKLRKRESTLAGSGSSSSSTVNLPPDGVNGTGKTHHFAVKSRDDRIDWMRELMLAKALRQKGEGFEVSVNGNMI